MIVIVIVIDRVESETGFRSANNWIGRLKPIRLFVQRRSAFELR